MQRATMWAGLALFLWSGSAAAQEELIGKIDLMSKDGVESVKGEWRYHEVVTGVGKDKNELEPKAHGKFDDSTWEVLDPKTLGKARGPGQYSWCWYRIQVAIPEQVGGKSFEGGPVWFQTTVDDYGEIWVDGAIDTGRGRGAVAGFNTKNRVRLQKSEAAEVNGKKKTVKRDAKPGDVFQIAVLGINSPLGNPPNNKIFLRSPTNLEFFSPDAKDAGADTPRIAPEPKGKVIARLDLLKKEDVEAIKGTWRRHPIELHTGEQKNEIEPKAHGKFDDSAWEAIEDPAELKNAFGPGKLSMYWCRINVTIPEKVNGEDVSGSEVWFQTKVDDYAEVWVNGTIDRAFGSSGRGAISGFNKQNEVLLTKSAKPGETITIAVVAINSPFGNPPGNRIFFHNGSTNLRFIRP